MKKTFSIFLIIIFCLLPLLSPIKALAGYDKITASNYLLSHPNNPWVTIGLVAAGETSIPSEYLKNIQTSSAIDLEAPILAIASLGYNPATYGMRDMIAELKSYESAGQLGDINNLNDDIFGVLALSASGLNSDDTVIKNSKNFLLENQNQDGGWGYAVGVNSDTNTTASAIVALASIGQTQNDDSISKALKYLQSSQNSDAGFPYDPKSPYGTASDSASTAWVIWVLNSLNINVSEWSKNGQTPADYLEPNQNILGFFEYQKNFAEDIFSPITTAYAVIALTGHTLPFSPSGGSANGSVVIGQTPFFTTINTPNAYLDQEYSTKVEAINAPEIAFKLIAGFLPEGLNFNEDGTINGTPTTKDTYSFTIKAYSSKGYSASKTFTITVKTPIPAAGFPILPTTSVAVGQVAGTSTASSLKMPEKFISIPADPLPQDNLFNTTTYLTKKGDTLWGIAKKYLKSGFKWREILNINTRSLLIASDPKTLKINYLLTIPN